MQDMQCAISTAVLRGRGACAEGCPPGRLLCRNVSVGSVTEGSVDVASGGSVTVAKCRRGGAPKHSAALQRRQRALRGGPSTHSAALQRRRQSSAAAVAASARCMRAVGSGRERNGRKRKRPGEIAAGRESGRNGRQLLLVHVALGSGTVRCGSVTGGSLLLVQRRKPAASPTAGAYCSSNGESWTAKVGQQKWDSESRRQKWSSAEGGLRRGAGAAT